VIPVSPAFECALRGSHLGVYRATLLNTFQTGTSPLGLTTETIGGSVRLDGTADERGALDLTVPGTCGQWPDNQFEPLAPFGQEVFVERGIGGLQAPAEVHSLPAGIIVGWPSTAASIPAGWSRVGQLDDRFLKSIPNGLTNPGTAGGAASHTHTVTGHTHTLGSHTHDSGTVATSGAFTLGASGAINVASNVHLHTGTSPVSNDNTSSTTPSVDATNNLPAYEGVIWIQSDGSTDGIPDGAVTWFDETTLPSGWTQHAAGNARYLRGATSGGNGGSTAGGNTHTHTSPNHTHTTTHSHPASTSSAPTLTSTAVNAGSVIATSTHTHGITWASTAAGASGNGQLAFSTDSLEPPYYTLALAENTSGGELGTLGMIVPWLGLLSDIPAGWALCDGSSGTPDLTGRFIKNATTLSTDVGDTGGASTHTHTGTNHSHTVPSHTHTRTYGNSSAGNAGAAGSLSKNTHPHDHGAAASGSGSGSTGNAAPAAPSQDHEPQHVQVAFIMLVSDLPDPYLEECEPEYVPLGYFRIETVEQDDAPRSPIRITARDRMAAIIEARMLAPRTFAAGTRFDAIFEDLVLEIYPSAVLVIDDDVAGSTLREAATVEEDRFAFLRDLADSRGRIMYFNRSGELVVTEAPSTDTPVFTVNEGPDGVLVKARRQLSRAGVYNAVVAKGTEADLSGGDPPAYAVVWDDNPSSATYFFGAFGQVPRYYASPFLYTDAQAASAAASILSRTTGLPYSIDLTAIPHPGLDPLDPITVVYERECLDDAALDLPGGSGNYASTPDVAALDITGDIDIRVEITPDDWTPAADMTIAAKWTSTGSQRSYRFNLRASGVLRFSWSPDGGSANQVSSDSTAATGFTNGDRRWVRVTLDVSSGTTTFYTSEDGENWTQLGAAVVTGATSIFSSTATGNLGASVDGTADLFNGLVHQAQIRSGINGPMVASPDFRRLPPGTVTFTDDAGRVWTVNGTASVILTGEQSDVPREESHVIDTITIPLSSDQAMAVNSRSLVQFIAGEVEG
jgi:hypothetical protein